jgi:methionine biosynthesis protein MetW
MRYNYKTDIDLSDRNTSWFHILRLVGSDKRVLDIGCATGHLTKHLAANNCEVVGVELEKSFASEAVSYCQEVIVGDIQEDSTLSRITGRFDVIVFGDVLEHLSCPQDVLNNVRRLLNDGGFIIVSVPNIALWRVRIALLFGKFEYNDRGVLDKTHLRFYTFGSAKELLKKTGYICMSVNYRFDFPFYSRKLARWTIYLGDILPSFLRRFFPTLFAMQFIFSARLSVPDDSR